jgi:hypothetical protein
MRQLLLDPIDKALGALLEEAGHPGEAPEILWNPYIQDGVRHPVLSDDESLTAARLGLTLGVRVVLAAGLALLGISAPRSRCR